MMFFFSTSHPLRALFSPQVRLTERAECLVMPASCVQSDSAWRESLHLACTMVCQYTSLCVPVFYDTSHPAGIMSHSSGMHVRTGASHKRRCTGDRAMQVFPTSPSHLFAKAYAACEATDRFCHAYCTAITLHFACLFFQHVAPSPVPLQPPGAPHPGGRAPRQ